MERIGEPGEALFWLAFSTAKVDKAASKRMGDFLNNYGLCPKSLVHGTRLRADAMCGSCVGASLDRPLVGPGRRVPGSWHAAQIPQIL